MTTILYSIARRESGQSRYSTIAAGFDARHFEARLQQDGIDQRIVRDWQVELALSATAALQRVERDAAAEQLLTTQDAAADTSEATSPAGWRSGELLPFGAFPYVAASDVFEHHSAGPSGESYRLVATAVHAASAAL